MLARKNLCLGSAEGDVKLLPANIEPSSKKKKKKKCEKAAVFQASCVRTTPPLFNEIRFQTRIQKIRRFLLFIRFWERKEIRDGNRRASQITASAHHSHHLSPQYRKYLNGNESNTVRSLISSFICMVQSCTK